MKDSLEKIQRFHAHWAWTVTKYPPKWLKWQEMGGYMAAFDEVLVFNDLAHVTVTLTVKPHSKASI